MTSQLFVLESNTPLTISYSTYQKKKKKNLSKKLLVILKQYQSRVFIFIYCIYIFHLLL
jgi:hypothetical protein